MRCPHCPLQGGRCRGEELRRLCTLVDPEALGYDPRYLSRLSPDADPPAYPSLARQAVNLAGAVASHVASGLAEASESEKARRLAVCRACPSFDATESRCRECGCYMEAKAGWESGTCPLGKWDAGTER